MFFTKIVLLSALMMPLIVFADENTVDPVLVTTSMGSQQQPNLYNFKSGSLHINYSTSGIDGKPRLSYQKGRIQLSFVGDDIRTAETDLGIVVSVTTTMTVDTGSTSFSVLIPKVNLDASAGSTAKITTQAIETKHRFSAIPAFSKGQVDTYKVIPLVGQGSFVMF